MDLFRPESAVAAQAIVEPYAGERTRGAAAGLLQLALRRVQARRGARPARGLRPRRPRRADGIRSPPARDRTPARHEQHCRRCERLLLPLVRRFVSFWVRPSVLPDDARRAHSPGTGPSSTRSRSAASSTSPCSSTSAASERCRMPLAPLGPGTRAARVRARSSSGARASSRMRIDRRMPEALRDLRDARGGRHRVRRGHRAGEPVLGPRAGSRALVVPAAGRRGLGHRRALPQGPVAADQRPQPRWCCSATPCRCSRR